MRKQWQALRELIWSSRYDPVANHERRIVLLQTVLAIAIALAAGPEIFVAAEMTAVMELLGAVLFLTAMKAGAQLLAISILSAIRGIAFPTPLPPVNAVALIYAAGHATWCVAMALNGRYSGTPSLSKGGTGG